MRPMCVFSYPSRKVLKSETLSSLSLYSFLQSRQRKWGAWCSVFFFSPHNIKQVSELSQESLKMLSVTLHTWLFFTRPWFLSIASFTNERRALGGGLQPDLAQLCSVSFGISVHKELQDPRAESVTLHIEHRAGTIAEGRQNRWHAILMSGYLQPAVCPTLL